MKLPSIEGIDPKKLSRAVRKDGFTLNLQEMLDAVKGALVLLAINNLESALKAEKLMSTYNSLWKFNRADLNNDDDRAVLVLAREVRQKVSRIVDQLTNAEKRKAWV